MLNVLGAGCAYPDRRVDEFAGNLRAEGARTFLRPDYLRETANCEPAKAWKMLGREPTEIAVRACREALARAGIDAERVGLVVGEAVLPAELVPAEAQRVAGSLGLKVPAFDIATSGAGLPFYLDLLSRWRSAAVPECVLCFSLASITPAVDYRGGGLGFGDGAGAAVVSPSLPGKLRLERSFVRWADGPPASFVNLPANGHARFDLEGWRGTRWERMREIIERLEARGWLQSGGSRLLASRLPPEVRARLIEEQGIGGAGLVCLADRRGEMLGAGSFCALAEEWSSFEAPGFAVIAEAGCGRVYGGVVLAAA